MCKGTSLDACNTKAQGTQTTPSGAAKSEPQLFGIGTFSEPRLLTGLDPMVATVLEWGHSLTDDQWAVLPADQKEFKLSVSEWLLNSTSANDLLNDRDHDSHTPLLLTVHATHYSPGRARAMNRNPETLQEKAERRKRDRRRTKPLERQGQVLALVLQPLVHNVLLNLLILQVERPLAKAAKEASPPRAKTEEASPPGAVENTD